MSTMPHAPAIRTGMTARTSAGTVSTSGRPVCYAQDIAD